MAAVVIAASAATTVYPATAQPPAPPPAPSNSSDALKQYKDLSSQAEKLNEEKLQAEEDREARLAEAAKAAADAEAAKRAGEEARAVEDRFRGQVDEFTAATLNGARFSSMSALLTGESQEDFLARASALKVLATDNDKALSELSGAVTKAEQARVQFEQAQRAAQEGAAAAERLIGEINQRKDALDKQAAEAKKVYNKLSASERGILADVGDLGVYIGPPGVAGDAVAAALTRRGMPYVFGATGPNQFDCSGLTMWAYARAGISIPRTSRSQYQIGKPVARGAWIPGDLLFYGSSAGSIHHVAMYIGDGKIVHASTTGVPVKVADVSGGGSDYFGSRRIVG